jgi:hypothetical protein
LGIRFSVTPILAGVKEAYLFILAFLPAEAGVTVSFSSVMLTLVGKKEVYLYF